jgi:Sensors of blue-light using FAD
MEQFVYVSAATKPFSETDLTTLLTKARARNAEVDVSGLLLYRSGSFLQILEGEPAAVQPIYDRIGRDPRHRDIVLLSRRACEARNFSDWRMGFVHLDRLRSLPDGFVDFFGKGETFIDLKGKPDLALRFLQGFRDGKWRRGVDVG